MAERLPSKEQVRVRFPSPAPVCKKLLLLFIFAFLIRLIALNQSLWLDEATTAKVISEYGYLGIIKYFSPFDFHPPLFYLLEKFWAGLFGYTEVSLRFPSVLFSLATGYFVYLIGRKIKNEKVAIWATVLFLFNPLIVYYSQEARMYMMATFFLTVSLYFLEKKLQTQNSKLKTQNLYSFVFSLFISLSFLTFYGSIFLIIPMLFYLIYKKQSKFFYLSFVILFFSFLLLSPLLFQQFINARKSLTLVVNWKNVLGTANFKNLILIPIKFSFGRISFYPKWLYWFLAGTWTIIVTFFVIKGSLKNKFLVFLIIDSLIIAVLFSFFTPLLQYFRFIYLIPLVSLLIALAPDLSINPSSLKLRRASRYIIIIGFFLLSFVYLLDSNFHREDWKSLSKSLPKDGTLYMIKASSDPVKYYRNDINVVDLLSIQTSTPSAKEIIVNPYVVDLYGLNYQKILMVEGYQKKDIKMFRGLYDEIWKRR